MRPLEKDNEETQKNHEAFEVRARKKNQRAKEKEVNSITKSEKVGRMCT